MGTLQVQKRMAESKNILTMEVYFTFHYCFSSILIVSKRDEVLLNTTHQKKKNKKTKIQPTHTYLVWEAQQKVEADHVLEEQEVSYYGQGLGLGRDQDQGRDQGLGLDLALEALTFREVVEEEAQEEEVGKESYLAEQLRQQLEDHFHDQTDKGHQVHKILFL